MILKFYVQIHVHHSGLPGTIVFNKWELRPVCNHDHRMILSYDNYNEN